MHPAQADPREPDQTAEIDALRRQLWLRHGHHRLRDDGSLRCDHAPAVDFARDPLPRILAHLDEEDRQAERDRALVGDGDGTRRLCRLLYGRDVVAKIVGGSEALMLHDAATEIARLRTGLPPEPPASERLQIENAARRRGWKGPADNRTLGRFVAEALDRP